MGYGHQHLIAARGFSWKRGINRFGSVEPSTSPLGVVLPFYSWKDRLQACTGIHQPDDLAFSVPALLHVGGVGILTHFPSAPPFGYALGADLPCPDDPWTGTLGLPANGFFTRFIATHASILTSKRSTIPHETASPPLERSPTTLRSPASVPALAPLYLRRRTT